MTDANGFAKDTQKILLNFFLAAYNTITRKHQHPESSFF